MTAATYDFALDAEQEERAARLHRDSIVIDMMFYGPCSPSVWTDELVAEMFASPPAGDPMAGHRFLADKAARGEFPSYRALFDDTGATTGIVQCVLTDAAAIRTAADNLNRCLTGLPWLRRARTAADIRAAHAVGEHALWGQCQINMLRPGDLDLVDEAHALGVLDTVDLAYNRQNFIGAGCTEPRDSGLSRFGIEFVRRCNEVGVIVDTAHSGWRTTLEPCEVSQRPVVATHTSAAALYDCDRAKSDDELRAIAATGGVIGIYAVPFFLADARQQPHPTIELLLDHVAYVADLVGWQHVGLGTDWPPADDFSRWPADAVGAVYAGLGDLGFGPEHSIDLTRTLAGFADYRDLPALTRGLVGRGFTDDEIRGILGENFLRVFEDIVG